MLSLGVGGILQAIAEPVAVFILLTFTVLLLVFFVRPFALSIYRRYPGLRFRDSSLRFKTLCEEIDARGRVWFLRSLLQNQKSWRTYWSFTWVIPLGVFTALSLAYFNLPVIRLSQTGAIQNGWQAQLTITSLSFIVLIFLLDQISRSRYREGVVQEFFASSAVMPVIYYTLGSSGFVAYLYFYHTPEIVSPLLHDATFFLFTGTVLGIGYVYYRVARLIFFDPLDEMTISQIKHGIDLQLREQDREEISNTLLQQRLPSFATLGSNRSGEVEMAHEAGLEGYIVDIDLKKLREVCQEHADLFQKSGADSLFLNLKLGGRLQPGDDFISVNESVISPPDVPDSLVEGVAETVYCTSDRAWKTGDRLIERNLGQIGEGTRAAINDKNPASLEKHLGFYTDLLQHATQLNRETARDDGTTPEPVSDLINYIFREFHRILEAAVETGSSDLIGTIRGEIFRISLAYHRQNEIHLFDDSIKLYAYFYQVLASNQTAGEDEIQSILTNLNSILTMLADSLGRANTLDEVKYAVSDLISFYDVLESVLRTSIELDDADTFNKVWDLGGDAFITVRPKGDIFELRRKIEAADPDEDTDALERELEVKERQKEAAEALTSRFGETRFIAAARAYQAVQEGELKEGAFQEMFSDSIKHYSFKELVETYLGIRGQLRTDLLSWESEDADIFKGVQAGLPASETWLKDFFCAMGLLFIDEEQFDIDDLDEEDNPLADIEIDQPNYPDFAYAIADVSRSELAKTGVDESELDNLDEKKNVFLALHLQMEDLLERREEDRIINADLDPEKVENFRQSYISNFEEQFVLRHVLSDLDWLDIREYDESLDLQLSGFPDAFYPKEAFISEQSSEFVHHLDQKAASHIDTIIEEWLDENQMHLAESELDAYDAIPGEIENVCSCLPSEVEPKAVIISGYRARTNLRNSGNFDEDFQPHDTVIGGYSLDGETVPVYADSNRDFEALVLTGSNQSIEMTEYQREGEPVWVNIEQVTRNLLTELDSEGVEELSDEELRDHLQKVRLQIRHYGEIEVHEDFGTKITVSE